MKAENKKVHYLLIVHLSQITNLSEEIISFLRSKIIVTDHKKGDFIVKKGGFCDRLHFLRKGIVRGFIEDGDKDITTWISCEYELATSITGFFGHSPCKENIQFLENTTTESISYNDMHYCLKHFSETVILNRILMEKYYVCAEERAFIARVPNAIKRYQYFLQSSNGNLISRAPKKYIASYLGIRLETFSRMIKKINSMTDEIPNVKKVKFQ